MVLPPSSKRRQQTFLAERKKKAQKDLPEKKPDAAPRADKATRRRYLRQYVGWLWPHRAAIAVLFALAVIGAALDMVWPLAIKYIVDHLSSTRPGAKPAALAVLNVIGFGVLGLLLVKQAIDSVRSYRTSVLNAGVVFRLRRRLFDRLLHLPLGKLADMKTGGVVSRLASDVDSVSGLIQLAFISPGVAIIRVLLTIIVLFTLSWRLALAALIMLPPIALASWLWLRRVRPIYRSMRDDKGQIDGKVAETFGGIRVVRAFRREQRESRVYSVDQHTVIRKSLWAERMELVLEAFWGVLIPATSLVIVWYGGLLTLEDPPGAKIGDIFAFQIYAVLLLQPVWQIVSSVSQTNKSLAAMERVFEVLELPPDKPDVPDAATAPRRVDEIRLNGVGFEYRPGVPVVRDVSLTIRGGTTVALVGASGAGKTTLTDLVARFVDPTSGSIMLNGVDLRNLALRSYRGLLAVVQQETFLFDGTVHENIAYGRRSATREEVVAAAHRANADEFIRQLPENYETPIGERGFKLSGGQKQRISIARAILADPQILILDEATSNLDTESEQLIQEALSALLKGRTTLVIAHRLSTITHADLIVVLEQGQVIESGTHDELVEQRGTYFEMVERQRRSFAGETDLAEMAAGGM